MTLLTIVLIAFALTACNGVVVIPAWYAPLRDHTLECVGGPLGECSIGTQGSGGKL